MGFSDFGEFVLGYFGCFCVWWFCVFMYLCCYVLLECVGGFSMVFVLVITVLGFGFYCFSVWWLDVFCCAFVVWIVFTLWFGVLRCCLLVYCVAYVLVVLSCVIICLFVLLDCVAMLRFVGLEVCVLFFVVFNLGFVLCIWFLFRLLVCLMCLFVWLFALDLLKLV